MIVKAIAKDKDSRSPVEKKNIMVVGTIRNVAKTLTKELEIIENALANHNILRIILVESDSTDNTLEVASNIAKTKIEIIKVITLGKLRTIFPNGVQRIQHCRNIYVREIRHELTTQSIDLIMIVDLDGINKKLTKKSFDSCFRRNDWDVVLANQVLGYYDIYALREANWCPEDCAKTVQDMKKRIYPKVPKVLLTQPFRVFTTLLVDDYIERKSIYRKMIRINKYAEWIEVESGFGGLGLYKSDIFRRFDYGTFSTAEEVICEHVILNHQIRKAGLRIFINPYLINNIYCNHNLNKFTLVRICIKFKKLFVYLISKYQSKALTKKSMF